MYESRDFYLFGRVFMERKNESLFQIGEVAKALRGFKAHDTQL